MFEFFIYLLFVSNALSGRPKIPSVQVVYHVIRLNPRATSAILSPHDSFLEANLIKAEICRSDEKWIN